MSVKNFDCRSLPISKVTVLTDRAEVKRLVALQLEEGVHEIRIQNVTSEMIEDSVRVNGRGSAKIHEVMMKDTHVVKGQTDSTKVAAKREEMRKKTIELGEATDEKVVLEKKLDMIQNVIGSVGDKTGSVQNGAATAVINDATIEGLKKLVDFYGDTSNEVRQELRETKGKVEKLEQELRKLKNELEVMEHGGHSTTMRSIVVVVESDASGGSASAAELTVIYQTRAAAWSPKYDIRVSTDDEATTPTMQIHYFGSVRQTTGEDWNDCDLILSTAQPSLAGDVPELGTLEVSIRPPPQPQSYDDDYSPTTYGGPTVLYCGGAKTMRAGGSARMSKSMTVATAEAKENVMSSEFTIARKKPIPSDHDEHKVTIGVVTLKAHLSYECVPSKSLSVFLMAHAVNSSEYALLSGSAAVYFNGAFITKTRLKAVSPKEKFVCSLGVDTAVRVDRRPTKTYHEQLGIISKTSSTITEKMVSVKNAKNKPLLFTLKENIPRSNDQKITVTLISPAIPPAAATTTKSSENIPTEGVRLSVANNVEWTTTIGAQHTKEFLVKFKVEHPKEEKVDYNTKFA